MTLYLDAVWLLNFLLDGMLLLITQAILKEQSSRYRVLFGATIASLLVPITLFFPNTFLTSFIGKCIYSILIIRSTFRFYTITRFMKQLMTFYFVSFAVGGGLLAFHFLLQNNFVLSESGFLTFHSGLGDPVSWSFVVIGFPIVLYFTKRHMDKHTFDKIRYDQMYPVTITIKEQTFHTIGYIDSGNQLIDPISKKHVVICDEIFLQQWFTKEEWEKLRQAYESMQFDELPLQWQSFVQVIPFHGVDGKSNYLLGIRPSQVVVFYDEKEIVTNQVIIGVQFNRLTSDHRYHCLLHPHIVTLHGEYSA
ncbi:sigma-E processing peptidase SpoIIGA [Virgibacillus soli]|uniref:sigma-E processing peptidase SpoIIGA n=1 Tax=Paracerasibacillus soli TaxID=480284 RepID=UPI0035E4B58B